MKRAYFTVADSKNLPFAQQMVNSLRKFDKDTEIILFGEEQVSQANDPDFYYRATPAIAKMLFDQGFTEVCKLDADMLILGDLSHIWESDFDVAVINNSNPKDSEDHKKATGQTLSTLNISPLAYLNNGLVVMKNAKFVDHWLGLCYSEHFPSYQFREQDFLNILVFYASTDFGGPYKVRFLDHGDKWHGTISKGFAPQTKLIDGKVMLEKNDIWPTDEDKQIVVYHYGGGPNTVKGNYRLIFPSDVAKHIDKLIK